MINHLFVLFNASQTPEITSFYIPKLNTLTNLTANTFVFIKTNSSYNLLNLYNGCRYKKIERETKIAGEKVRVQQNYVTKTIRNSWLAQEFSLWPTKSSTTEIEIETREQRKKERGIAYLGAF